jgi:hypothetical protein
MQTSPRPVSVRVRTRRFEILVTTQVLVLLAYPTLDHERFGFGTQSFVNCALMLATLHASLGTGRRFLMGSLLVLLALSAAAWPGDTWHSTSNVVSLALQQGILAFGGIAIAAEVFRGRRVDRDTLFGAVAIYLLMGFAFATSYMLLEALAPGSFAGSEGLDHKGPWADLLFFSFTSLTTTGFGDITPITSRARSLVILQYTAGVLYIAFVVARLVGLYRSDP